MAGRSSCPSQLPGLLTRAVAQSSASVPSRVPHSPYRFCPFPRPALFFFRLFSVHLYLPFSLILFFPTPQSSLVLYFWFPENSSALLLPLTKLPSPSLFGSVFYFPRLCKAHLNCGEALHCSRKALFQILQCFAAPTLKSGLI